MANIERCEPSDPHRCQAMIKNKGQCLNKAVQLADGSYGTYCLAHGGNKQLEAERSKNHRIYMLGKWQQKLEKHADHENIKSLRDDIGVLRMMLEERFARIGDATDLMIQSSQITDLVMKIEKLVASCHKLEGSMGQLLDKQAILNFASEVVGVITVELEGQEDKIKSIGDKILLLVGHIGAEDDT